MHELNHIWFAYFWPSLMGNGPEALVQTVVYGLAAYLLIPPFRRWINAHFKAQHEANAALHAKLDHVIKHHPDIPKFVDPKSRPTRGADGKFTARKDTK